MPPGEITKAVREWARGEAGAADRLFPMVYDELRRMARRQFRGESPGHTLQSTALVHELFLKLSANGLEVHDRTHFYAIAARQMRNLLIDHARAAKAEKRGGGQVEAGVELGEAARADGLDLDVLALDQALTALEAMDERMARGVELRYFAGLSEREAAEVLGISVATFKRDWQFARVWLRARL